MNNNITQGLFRISALLYARNNTSGFSTRQIIRKIIEDALLHEAPEDTILVSSLVSKIDDKYVIALSCEEVSAIIKDQKFKEYFEYDYNNDNELWVSLKHKRRIVLEHESQSNRNLNDHIMEFVKTQNLDTSKIDVLYRFLYGVFTTNLEGYRQLLKEKSITQIEDSSFEENDKIIINKFLDWNNQKKNEAIFNLASYALEYCMLTNKKDALVEMTKLKNKNLYLDSNILFRAIGVNGEDRRLRTEQFLTRFSKIQQNLFVTKETDIEIRETIDYYITKLNRAVTPAVKVNPKVYVETVDIDGFYKAYFKWKAKRAEGNINQFKMFLLAKYEDVLGKYHIQKDSIKPFEDENVGEQLKEYESQLLNQSEEKTFSAAEVDARNIIWMEHKRKGQNEDIYQVKYFFVSSDQHLRRWDYNRNRNEVPIVILPSQWLSMALRYLERSDDDYKSFVCFLNMKVHQPSLSEEQLLFAIEGISEITSDIKQQRHLIKTFIKEDFNDELQGLSNEELQEIAKNFAETEFDKALKDLELENRSSKDQITQLKKKSFENNRALTEANEQKIKHEKIKGQLESKNAEYKDEINAHRKEKREQFIKNQIKKWRWKTWWWIIIIGVLFLLLLSATIWLQISTPESEHLFRMLSDNPIVTILGTIINALIEIPLIVNICGKYDISKTKEFKEQLYIPEELQEIQ